jgi:hypothetical protein
MSKASKTDKQNATIAELESRGEMIRTELGGARQAEVFRLATEVGYLTALADGTVEDAEVAACVRALELLSVGTVIEWETEELLGACRERVAAEGAAARAKATGEGLKALGQAAAGLLVGAIVARAAKKIEKKEADVLKAVGHAAGLGSDEVAEIVKRAAALG